MLREFGVEQCAASTGQRAGCAPHARAPARSTSSLCDTHFDDEPMTGQDLLDDLRLAHSCCRFPRSSSCCHRRGDRTRRWPRRPNRRLDSYLLKPHTATALGDRLHSGAAAQARAEGHLRRHRSVKPSTMPPLCQQRVRRTLRRYWLLCGAHRRRAVAARWASTPRRWRCSKSCTRHRRCPWAKLGIARAQA